MTTGTCDSPLDVVIALVRSERAALACLARAEGLSPEDAVDCVQDALCTILTLAQRGKLPANPAALPSYLAGIVRNRARNERRLHRRARPHELLAPDAAPPAGGTSLSLAPEALVASAEEHVRLRACVDTLCDTQKAVVTLRLLEERGGEDVADALHLSRGHVDVLLHRARAALASCMLR